MFARLGTKPLVLAISPPRPPMKYETTRFVPGVELPIHVQTSPHSISFFSGGRFWHLNLTYAKGFV